MGASWTRLSKIRASCRRRKSWFWPCCMATQLMLINPAVFGARQAVIAAAQVIYNHAVARGLWPMHPEIQAALGDEK